MAETLMLRRSLRDGNRTARVVGLMQRLACAAALWTAPIPMVHCHGTLADASPDAVAWLTDHLRGCHAAIEPLAEHDFGWHVHFVMPSSDETADPSAPLRPDHAPPRSAAVAPGLSGIVAHLAPWSCSLFPFSATPDSLSGEPLPCDAAPDFYATFATSLPRPLRFGVLRC